MRKKMANLIDAISDNSQAIDRAILADLHKRRNAWDYFGFTKSDFVALSQSQLDALLPKFYFDHVKGGSIDASINSRIRGSDEIRITKIRDGSKMEMQVEASSTEKKLKQVNLWARRVFFLVKAVTSIFQKQICQRTPYSTLIRAIKP